MPSHFYNCRTFISIPATTASEKSSGAREHQNQARERGLAGGELVAVVQLPINLSHTWQSSALPLPGRITFKDQVQKLSKENYSLIKETETRFPCSRLLVKKDQHKQRWWIDTWQINISHSLAHISKIFTKCTPPQTSLPGKYMKSAPPSTIYLNVNMWNLLHPSPIYLNSPPPFPPLQLASDHCGYPTTDDWPSAHGIIVMMMHHTAKHTSFCCKHCHGIVVNQILCAPVCRYAKAPWSKEIPGKIVQRKPSV